MGDTQFVLGFNLAGVSTGHVIDKSSANKTFEDMVAAGNVGIVVMDKSTFELLSERNRELALTLARPTVVTLSHDVQGDENLRLMIKRSLGVDLWK